jgi:hypothetical protein
VTIYDGLIFDSNLKYSIELTRLHLEFCIDAVYEGILHGYEFVPRIVHSVKTKVQIEEQPKKKRRHKREYTRKKIKNLNENKQES